MGTPMVVVPLALALVVSFGGLARAQEPVTYRDWIRWPRPDRILYVAGFMADLRRVDHCPLGQRRHVAPGVALGPAEIADRVTERF
jgi:hypothetical protein